MAGIWSDVSSAMREAVVAAWPEMGDPTPAGGVYHLTEIGRLLLSQKPPPFAMMEFMLRRETNNAHGITNYVRTGPVRLYRVDIDDGSEGFTDTFLDQMDTLMTYLERNRFSVGQRISAVESQISPADTWLGRYFLNTRKPFVCAYVEFDYTVGGRFASDPDA